MARYRYVGPGPIEVADVTAGNGTEIIRPGDVREFDAEPSWGPWEPLDEPAPEADEPDETPAPAPLPPLTAPPAKEF